MRLVIMRLSLGIGLAIGAPLTALAAPAPSPATTTGCGGAALVTLHTLYVEAKPRKKSYHRGETVVADVVVTRPADEDPAGEDQPMPRPTSEPAADVEVGAALWVGNTYRWDYATTDEEGHAVIEIKMPKDSDTGWARGEFAAEKMYYSNNGCPDIREVGYASYPKFVKILP